MELKNPIYSEETRCRDCYRCIRECPVKAIRVVDGDAEVIPEDCILCGHCVAVCPVSAKKVRDDLRRAVHLLTRKKNVILSLAPSFIGEFKEVSVEQLIGAIRRLGFFGVSETALGAQEVSAFLRDTWIPGGEGIQLSSACPAAVDLITRFFPKFTDALTPVYSPLLAHCVYLRKHYAESDLGIVFAGPCIAKKKEADLHPELLDIALTFEDLRRWFEISGINPAEIEPTPQDVFIPLKANNGTLYPVEGGMTSTLQMEDNESRCMTLSGVRTIIDALESLDKEAYTGKLFIELLACENGCIGGPKANVTTPVGSRMAVLDYAESTPGPGIPVVEHTIGKRYTSALSEHIEPNVGTLTAALESIGKFNPEEELNCGACGYGSCRDLARALIDNKAETKMCISYMRQLAQKKANALIRTIPFGVVIVDKNLAIIDSNSHFTELFRSETAEISSVIPGLHGADLRKIVAFHALFSQVLTTGEDIIQTFIHNDEKVVVITIFTVEHKQVVGALIRDVTTTESRREQIIEKAQEVIRNTSMTAQQIAFLMGKNSAQSEKILNSLIESFSIPSQPDSGGE